MAYIVIKGTKYAYQSINHVNHLFLVSAISSWRDSSFLAIINYRGPYRKPTDPIFLLLKAHMLVPELTREIPSGLLEDSRGKGLI